MSKIVEINLHNEVVKDAKWKLERFIVNCDDEVKEIRVIHGYKSGTAIKDMVRDNTQLRSKRIKRRRSSLNAGETILELY